MKWAMNYLASPASVVSACLLIVVANLALLTAAGWNRWGGATAELSLTERELAMPESRQDEDAGVNLSVVMTHEPPGLIRRAARWKGYTLPAVDYVWLDRAKLLGLGFRLDLDAAQPGAAEYYSHARPRRAYIVVEYDGDAWNRWIRSREEKVRELRREVLAGTTEKSVLVDAEAVLAVDRTMRSRLIPVDVGNDAHALQLHYGGLRGHAVFAGLIRPKVVRRQDGVPELSGDVLGLITDRVHVSRENRRDLKAYLSEETWNEIEERERSTAEDGWPSVISPRYRATLAVGRRHEPWLINVATIEAIEEVTK